MNPNNDLTLNGMFMQDGKARMGPRINKSWARYEYDMALGDNTEDNTRGFFSVAYRRVINRLSRIRNNLVNISFTDNDILAVTEVPSPVSSNTSTITSGTGVVDTSSNATSASAIYRNAITPDTYEVIEVTDGDTKRIVNNLLRPWEYTRTEMCAHFKEAWWKMFGKRVTIYDDVFRLDHDEEDFYEDSLCHYCGCSLHPLNRNCVISGICVSCFEDFLYKERCPSKLGDSFNLTGRINRIDAFELNEQFEPLLYTNQIEVMPSPPSSYEDVWTRIARSM